MVSLRFIQDSDGQILGQVRNEVFGDPILDKTQVEERIRRAQRAILNPSRSTKTFLQGDSEDDEPTELSFSINCVSLQISGPDVADLSFCDLPGARFYFVTREIGEAINSDVTRFCLQG